MFLNADLQFMFKNQFDRSVALAAKLAGNTGKIVNEVNHIAVTSWQAHAAMVSKIAGARNASDLIQIQTEHAQTAYEAALARSRKIGELLTDLSRDAVKSMVADAEQLKAPVKPLSVAKRLEAAE